MIYQAIITTICLMLTSTLITWIKTRRERKTIEELSKVLQEMKNSCHEHSKFH